MKKKKLEKKIQAPFLIFSSLILLSIIGYLIGNIYIIQNYKITRIEETQHTTNTEEKMQFVFIDDDTTKYTIFKKDIHGAWIDWSFLFGNDWNEEKNKKNNKEIKNTNSMIKKDYVWGENIDELINTIENTNIKNTNSKNNKKKTPTECTLPRGGKIANWKRILAYEQRTDAPNICNIQKRTCKKGKLSWSYKQQSCKKNVPIKITKKTVKIYHVDPHTEGKYLNTRNQTNKVFKSYIIKNKNNTLRNNKKKWTITTTTTIPQIQISEENCSTPRGTTVNNGQFVKAYYNKYGFSDKVCEVELRICLNGTLNGTFSNPECTYIPDYTSEERYSNPDNIE